MKSITLQEMAFIKDKAFTLTTIQRFGILLSALMVLFFTQGAILGWLDPTAAVLDIGMLSVLLFACLAGVILICGSRWLQEILWDPFKAFRKQLHVHFNQLSSWQQCVIYFSVFFLLLYACLWALAIIL